MACFATIASLYQTQGVNTMLKMTDIDITRKRLLIREDLNVPMKDGHITNDARIKAALKTIQLALNQHAAVILLSHLGRPTEGQFDEQFSLAPVAEYLTHALQQSVRLERDWLAGFDIQPGEVVLCENVRFQVGEKANDPTLAKRIAQLGDIFVMDAFATAHRAHASTVGVAQAINCACAGPLLIDEITALDHAIQQAKPPRLAIVGGAKVSTKLTLLDRLLTQIDHLILGGGIANTFLAAQGTPMGRSLYEPDLIPAAQTLLQKADEQDVSIPLPTDVIVANAFSENAIACCKKVDTINSDEMILDVGPETSATFTHLIHNANTIIWNGPVGVFEFEAFAAGTQALAQAIANSHAHSLAGGGDTIAAIEKYGIQDQISYISTGGGAFLEYLQGNTLPALAILTEHSAAAP